MVRIRLFAPDREGVLVSRPNRFVIMAESEGELLRCHCPNPGRMLELATPRTPLILEKGREGRATAWTAVAARYKGAVVPLAPGRTNSVARELVIPALWPDLRELRGEVTRGSSRFDFAAGDSHGRRHLIEVKTCSLVEEGLALFPDAPSSRAVRHLEELAAAAGAGDASHVLFVIVHGNARRIAPNIHTDRAFSAALIEAAAAGVELRAAEIAVESSGFVVPSCREVPVDLAPAHLAAGTRVSFFLVFRLEKALALQSDGREAQEFPPGDYVCAGSTLGASAEHLVRDIRKGKLDDLGRIGELARRAVDLKALPIVGTRDLACELAVGLAELGAEPVDGFAHLGCGCAGHLFRFSGNPLTSGAFVALLMSYRHARHAIALADG